VVEREQGNAASVRRLIAVEDFEGDGHFVSRSWLNYYWVDGELPPRVDEKALAKATPEAVYARDGGRLK